ncbi:hypothetical protein FKW77_004191 [Venturia effusa]|uniref:Apple domain-containing protein n=1 Tax=Venturia effusa TaxID=50376 RepID=A0A517LPZ1_9PEZI|nr:hypothetical protein FKW77_004191 [Venturia effusa]
MGPSHPDYEGLQVRVEENYPEVVYYSDKEVLPSRLLRSPQQKPRRFTRRKFIPVLSVIVLLIVGGGVGIAIAARKNQSPSGPATTSATTSSTPTSLSVSPATATSLSSTSSPSVSTASSKPTVSTTTTISTSPTATAGMGTYNCPADNGTTYSPNLTKRYNFKILCDTDFYGKGVNGKAVVDVQNVLATSLQACIDQCASQRYAGSNCSAVAYGANITQALARGGVQGNCFLKDQRSAIAQADSSGQQEAAFLSPT